MSDPDPFEDDVSTETTVGDHLRGDDEWPDPDTPPSDAAPGSAGLATERERGGGQFDEAYEEAGPDDSGSGSTPPD